MNDTTSLLNMGNSPKADRFKERIKECKKLELKIENRGSVLSHVPDNKVVFDDDIVNIRCQSINNSNEFSMMQDYHPRPKTKQLETRQNLRDNLISNSQKYRKLNKSIDFSARDTLDQSIQNSRKHKTSVFASIEKPSYLKSPPVSKIKSYIDAHSNWNLCKLGF